MRKACEIRVNLVKNCIFLFSNLNTFLKSYVVGSSHYIFFFRLLWVPYIDTDPFWAILEFGVRNDLNFFSSTQCHSSTTTLITSCVVGTGVNPPYCKMDRFFLRSLALSIPIYRNFQSNGVKWRSIKLRIKKVMLYAIT